MVIVVVGTLASFNPTLVRLRRLGTGAEAVEVFVSIPRWFD